MRGIALDRALQNRDLPLSFCGTRFTTWTSKKLRLIIDALTTNRIYKARDDKLTLCTKLLTLKPGQLTHFEQAGVNLALSQGSLEDARALVRGIDNVLSSAEGAEKTCKRRLRECQSCLSDVAESDYPTPPPGAPICHDPFTTCSECFTAHIESRTKMSQLDEIPCPEPGCDAVIDHALMKKYASASAFQRYDNALNKTMLKNLSDFISCANELCNYAGTVDLRFVSYINCPDCETRTCTTCRTDWHPDTTHEQNMANVRRAAEERDRQLMENEKRTVEGRRFAAYVGKHTKACPGVNCGARIEKNDGCDHMTCTRCEHEFCWLCLHSYDAILNEGNHMHADDCAHYRSEAGDRADDDGNEDFIYVSEVDEAVSDEDEANDVYREVDIPHEAVPDEEPVLSPLRSRSRSQSLTTVEGDNSMFFAESSPPRDDSFDVMSLPGNDQEATEEEEELPWESDNEQFGRRSKRVPTPQTGRSWPFFW